MLRSSTWICPTASRGSSSTYQLAHRSAQERCMLWSRHISRMKVSKNVVSLCIQSLWAVSESESRIIGCSCLCSTLLFSFLLIILFCLIVSWCFVVSLTQSVSLLTASFLLCLLWLALTCLPSSPPVFPVVLTEGTPDTDSSVVGNGGMDCLPACPSISRPAIWLCFSLCLSFPQI